MSKSKPTEGATLFRRPLVAICVILATSALRILHLSWRKNVTQLDRIDGFREDGISTIVAFWHGDYLPLFPLLSGRRAHVIVASGFRGDVIAGICNAFGYRPLLLGGQDARAVRDTLEVALEDGTVTIAVAVDGPIGPYHQPKAGLLHIAGEIGLPIVPLAINAWPRLVLAHRWDRMQLPLPFAKVALRVGDPVLVPSSASKSELAAAREELSHRLNSDVGSAVKQMSTF